MGCGSSTAINPHSFKDNNKATEKEDDASPLTQEEINDRIVCSRKAVEYKVASNLRINYAFLSQRGYYPDAPHKANQDTFCVIPEFMGSKDRFFFGVFDGHGSTGDDCSQFARNEVPKQLQQLLKAEIPFEKAYSQCFIQANEMLHDSSIDDSMSGTTAITVFLHGNMIHVANVGDSRAVIAREENGALVAHPLSIDQTPFRQDERERVKKCGARIMTLDQLEGLAPIHENWGINLGEELDEDGDPPRIWSPAGNYPGTAFTRSIGDDKAETLGVFAEPEILSLKLTPSDRFIVIASDGVWEFLTSQAVVDMVNNFTDPVAACRTVVAESYKLWLNYEVRTDDITMICIYLQAEPTSSFTKESIVDEQTRITMDKRAEQLRPVRRGMSKAKRRAQMTKDMTSMITEEDLKYNVAEHVIPKTAGELEEIKKVVKTNVLFNHLNAQQRKDIFSVMEKISVKNGDVIIKQGDPGDKFYCVASGNYDVKVRSESSEGTSEDTVHTYLGSTYPSFGELALMHGNPRSSSVIAITDGRLWAIDCRAFRKIVMKSPTPVLLKTLCQVDIFKSLTVHQLHSLADQLSQVQFEDGEYIIKQGETGSTFYIIEDGNVVCTINEEGKPADEKGHISAREVLRLKDNQYFGERALLNDAPRAANVISVGTTKLLQIGREAFESVLGSLNAIIEEDRKRRELRGVFDSQVKDRYRCPDYISKRLSSVIDGSKLAYLCQVVEMDNGYIGTFKSSDDNLMFSVKAISKQKVDELGCAQEILKEKSSYKAIDIKESPMIPQIVASWSTSDGVFIAFDRLLVADLHSLLQEMSSVDEETVRQYAAQILLGLESVHAAGYVYRAINSEQILVSEDGVAQIQDFRFAKNIFSRKTFTLCGTPEYLSPEIVSAQGHDFTCDYWALGVLIYEMLCGSTPFATEGGNNDGEAELATYSKISRFTKGGLSYPTPISKDAKNIIEGLLTPSVNERLGCQGKFDASTGGSAIRAHPWFSSISWIDIAAGVKKGPQIKLVTEKIQEMQTRNAQERRPFDPYLGKETWFQDF